jgi:hypothetical protein
VKTIPDAKEVRQYETTYLDVHVEAAFQAVGKFEDIPNATTIDGRNRETWRKYLNLLLRIADARATSQFYHWFDENTLDETPG